MWTKIRLLLLDLHCLLERLLKHFSRRQKQTTFVVIGVLRVLIIISLFYKKSVLMLSFKYCDRLFFVVF